MNSNANNFEFAELDDVDEFQSSNEQLVDNNQNEVMFLFEFQDKQAKHLISHDGSQNSFRSLNQVDQQYHFESANNSFSKTQKQPHQLSKNDLIINLVQTKEHGQSRNKIQKGQQTMTNSLPFREKKLFRDTTSSPNQQCSQNNYSQSHQFVCSDQQEDNQNVVPVVQDQLYHQNEIGLAQSQNDQYYQSTLANTFNKNRQNFLPNQIQHTNQVINYRQPLDIQLQNLEINARNFNNCKSPSQNQNQDHYQFYLSQQPSYVQQQDVKCDCLERLRLKVEQELDRLRGEFKKKESELISPLVSKYDLIDQKIESFKSQVLGRVKEYEQGMMMQEQTIGLLINSIQSINNLVIQNGGSQVFDQRLQALTIGDQQSSDGDKEYYNYPRQIAIQLEKATQMQQQVIRETKEDIEKEFDQLRNYQEFLDQQNADYGQDNCHQVIVQQVCNNPYEMSYQQQQEQVNQNEQEEEQENEEDISECSTPPSDNLSLEQSFEKHQESVLQNQQLQLESEHLMIQESNRQYQVTTSRQNASSSLQQNCQPVKNDKIQNNNLVNSLMLNDSQKFSTGNKRLSNRQSKLATRVSKMSSNIYSHLQKDSSDGLNLMNSVNQKSLEPSTRQKFLSPQVEVAYKEKDQTFHPVSGSASQYHRYQTQPHSQGKLRGNSQVYEYDLTKVAHHRQQFQQQLGKLEDNIFTSQQNIYNGPPHDFTSPGFISSPLIMRQGQIKRVYDPELFKSQIPMNDLRESTDLEQLRQQLEKGIISANSTYIQPQNNVPIPYNQQSHQRIIQFNQSLNSYQCHQVFQQNNNNSDIDQQFERNRQNNHHLNVPHAKSTRYYSQNQQKHFIGGEYAIDHSQQNDSNILQQNLQYQIDIDNNNYQEHWQDSQYYENQRYQHEDEGKDNNSMYQEQLYDGGQIKRYVLNGHQQ
ncbi:UNKNOWN [Stylonychia lemnae]|uniref:Uncharacterized protein n=1 Tax=Stylonychia lemnae TaxID=5949 RepID=A0A078A1I2_STYLE|nr:UNKNOWN [Stylonychia lemnae]|eukprot:CDW75965.1 UNKNOWN [Stylonychia lemnae]